MMKTKWGFKKTLSICLAIVFVFSTVITASLFTVAGIDNGGANSGNAGSSQQIKNDGGKNSADGVEVSKTITGTDKENEFIIELEVNTTQNIEEIEIPSADVATTLIFDISTSMSYNLAGNTTSTESNQRIYKAKQAALDFLSDYAADSNGGKRYISIVVFGSNASVQKSWLDVSIPANYTTVVNAINAITVPASNGTNIQGGLMMAEYLMSILNAVVQSDYNDNTLEIKKNNRYSILLTDGQPSYHVSPSYTVDNISSIESIVPGTKGGGSSAVYATDVLYAEAQATSLKSGINKLFTIAFAASTKTCYEKTLICDEHVHSSSCNGYLCGLTTHEHDWKDSCYRLTCTNTNKNHSHNKHCYDRSNSGIVCEIAEHSHSLSKCGWGPVCGIDTHTHSDDAGCYVPKTSIGDWLSGKIASTNCAQDADDDIDLGVSFENINKIITLLAEAWTVTDIMGDHIEFMNFVDKNGVKLDNHDYANVINKIINPDADEEDQYSKDVLTWTVKEDAFTSSEEGTTTTYTYVLRYRVRLNNQDDGFSFNTSIDTNESAILKYVIVEKEEIVGETSDETSGGNSGSGELEEEDFKEITFPSPAVEGYKGRLVFNKTGENDISLEGTIFTLKDEATGWTATAAYSNGTVTFENIPSGHSYKLQETSFGTGYQPDNTKYNVAVNYSIITSNIPVIDSTKTIGNKLLSRSINIEHWFETGYNTGTYQINNNFNADDSIKYGETKNASSYVLASVPDGFTYNADKTATGTNSSITYASAPGTLIVYYSANQPADKTISIQHWFETGYNTGEYAINESYNGSDSIAFGQTKNAPDYILESIPGGFTYNANKTTTGANASITYASAPGTLIVYYSANKPADKTISIQHWFETGYNTGVYELNSTYNASDSITFGETKNASGYVLASVPNGFNYNAAKTTTGDNASIDFASAPGTLIVYYSANQPADKTISIQHWFETGYNTGVYALNNTYNGSDSISYGQTKNASGYVLAAVPDGFNYNAAKTTTGDNASITFANAPGTLIVYYSANQPADKTISIQHWFETGYNTDVYALNNTYNGSDSISYGQTKNASGYILGTIPNGFTYNANKTTTGANASITFENAPGTLIVYYSANKPADQSFNVEYYFETGYLTGIYNINNSETLSNQPLAWGETFSYTGYNKTFAGFTFNGTKTTSEGFTSVEFDGANKVIKLYYSADKPADKAITIEHWFETGYQTGVYTINETYNGSDTIAFGETKNASGYVLAAVPNGFSYNANKTTSGTNASITFANAPGTLIVYYSANIPADEAITIEHWFETGYQTGVYTINNSHNGSDSIAYGTTKYAANYVLGTIPGGFTYNADKTTTGDNASISYAAAPGTLIVYYSANKPANQSFNVEYYFETGYLTGIYNINSSETLSNQPLAWGETFSYTGYNKTFAGFTFNGTKTTSEGYTSVEFDGTNKVIKLYYSANIPADKTYDVEFYFETGYQTGVYNINGSYGSTGNAISYGNTVTYSIHKLNAIPQGFEFNETYTTSQGFTSVSYDGDGSKVLKLYYSALEPNALTYNIEHWFETGYLTGVYEADSNETITGLPIRFGQEFFAKDNVLSTIPAGFEYNTSLTENGSNAGITYDSAPGKLIIYYSALRPADKSFDVEYYFETAYGSGIYVINDDYTLENITISFGQSRNVNEFNNITANKFTYNSVKTGLMMKTVTTFDETITLELYYSADIPDAKEFTVEYYFETGFNTDDYAINSDLTLTESISYGGTAEIASYLLTDGNIPEKFMYNSTKTSDIGAVSITFDQAPGALKIYYSSTDVPEDVYSYTVILHYTEYDFEGNQEAYNTITLPIFTSYNGESVSINASQYAEYDGLPFDFLAEDSDATAFTMNSDRNGTVINLYYEYTGAYDPDQSIPLGPGESSGTPQTGDSSQIAIFLTLALISFMGLIVMVIRDRKRKEA